MFVGAGLVSARKINKKCKGIRKGQIMKSKYYNDAIIGNKNLTASFSNKGELLRLFYPTSDYKQFVEELLTGVKINDSAIIYMNKNIWKIQIF